MGNYKRRRRKMNIIAKTSSVGGERAGTAAVRRVAKDRRTSSARLVQDPTAVTVSNSGVTDE